MRFNIRLKLIAYTFFMILLVGFTISWISIVQSKNQILSSYEKECRQTTNLIAENITDDVYFLDTNSLRAHLENAKINPDISHIQVADEQGKILLEGSGTYVSSQKILSGPFSQKILEATQWISTLEDNDLKIGGPLKVSDGSIIGYLEIDFTLKRAKQIIENSTRVNIYLSLICLAAGALLAYFISSRITKPFLELVKATHEIGHGHFNTRVNIRRKDELGMLAQAFNQMSEELGNSTRSILQLNEKLKRSNKELEQFAYVASHDLQEPIYIIQGFANNIIDEHSSHLNEDMRFLIERIQNAAKRMTSLVEGLLEFSRVNTNSKPFETVDLQLVVQEIITDLELRIKETKAVIECDKLPKILADKIQMRQLFQNLIGNALKFHKKDQAPFVKIQCDQKENFMEIKIQDNGIGLEEEYANKIFVPFQRLHTHQEYEGNGIGLAICEKIILRHNGKISVKSKPGEGCIFTIELPL